MAGPQKLTEGNDNWSGFLGFDDYVLGLGGADTMNGAGGNDRLYGGAGGDTIRGGDGDDILDGGDDLQLGGPDSDNSTDHLLGEAGNDTLRGKAGNDILDGGIGADNLYGGDGRDTLFSTSLPTVSFDVDLPRDATRLDAGGWMDGGAGDDTIVTSHDFSGTMTIVGGDGIDTLAFARDVNHYANLTVRNNSVDLLSGTGITPFHDPNGTASRLVVREIENIDGGVYHDFFSGNADANVLRGFGGNDSLRGRGGADTLDGGDGIDTASWLESLGVDVDLNRATQIGNDAQGDVLISIENLVGSDFDDKLRGNSAANRLFGGNGDDRLEGRGGADIIDGGASFDTASYESSSAAVSVTLDEPSTGVHGFGTGGDAQGDELISMENLVGSAYADVLTGHSRANRLEGGAGGDTLNGLGGDDTLLGGLGSDTLNGGDDEDRLEGGDGNDVVNGGLGSDLIDGGFGNDTLNGEKDSDMVSFESWDPTGLFTQFGETIRIALGEGSASGTATRTVNGAAVETDTLTGFESVRGSNRAETIIGNSAGNVLAGRGGNDVFDGKGGNDILDGGAGTDTASYEQNSGRVIVTLRDGELTDSFATEHIRVGLQDIVVSNDILRSIENVTGTAFRDQLTGNTANNRLSGGAGGDTINGGGGDDVLVGGTGADFMLGGVGSDTFLYLSKGDSLAAASFDNIGDFALGQDEIDLSAIDANELVSGNQAFNFISFGQTPQAGDLTVNNVAIDSDGDGVNDSVFANVNFFVDGDAQPDFALGVLVAGSVGLSAADFVL